MFDIRYIQNQEKVKTRALTKILNGQKDVLISLLEKERKSIDSIVDDFMGMTEGEIPEYLVEALPVVMNKGMKGTKEDHKAIMPDNYSLGFNLETSPASIYLKNLEKLHLSQRKGSISKTTNDEVRTLIADGIDEGLSYGEIAKRIRETDPFVFSKSRATLIAVQEVGQAYGFGNWQPIEDMMADGIEFEKQWVARHDGKARETHLGNEALGWIPATETFSETGDMYAPSKEFRCRCYQKNRVV